MDIYLAVLALITLIGCVAILAIPAVAAVIVMRYDVPVRVEAWTYMLVPASLVMLLASLFPLTGALGMVALIPLMLSLATLLALAFVRTELLVRTKGRRTT